MILQFKQWLSVICLGIFCLLLAGVFYIKKNWDFERKCRFAQAVFARLKVGDNAKTKEKLCNLYPAQNPQKIYGMYCYKILSAICLTILSFFLVCPIALCSFETVPVLYEGYRVMRGQTGEGEKEVHINALLKGEEKGVDIQVADSAYTEEELEEKLNQAEEYLRKVYLGENESEEKIKHKLNLVEQIPDSAIDVEWRTDSSGLVAGDGEIQNQDLPEAEKAELVAVLGYGETEREICFALKILPQEKTESEVLWGEWREKLEQQDAATKEERYLSLPEEVNGNPMVYAEEGEKTIFILPCILVILLLLIPLCFQNRMEQKVKERKKEIARGYPDFIDRFVLLIGAGMTVQGTWFRIVEEYCQQKEKTGKTSYLYEEMLVTKRELENGVGESRAYEQFGKRMGLFVYLKFSNLIVQNLRKGTSDILHILEYEAVNALQERQEQAKKAGEEAGTKLLLPMMLMLLVVFGIIIYAAFQSM